MKRLIRLFLLLIVLIPSMTFALSKDYKDVVSKYYEEVKTSNDKVNVYLFYSKTCPHCKAEREYFKELDKKYDDINIYEFEVVDNKTNYNNMKKIKSHFNESSTGVPFTVIGNKYVLGFTSEYSTRIESIIDEYLEKGKEEYSLPILGKVDAKKTSISLIAVVLGFIDGFNPCAMWILLLLINMCISIKSRKKMLLVGLTFILTSGVVYFLSMLGLGLILDLTAVSIIRNLIALIAIGLGIYNLYVYIKTRNDDGCHVVDKKKRKSIINKLNEILSKNSIPLIIVGTIALALSVNLVELACSLGFPTIFLEILSINKITGLSKIVYLLLYIIFYLIDDLVVFLIAVFAFKVKGISTKYNKFVNLIGGILMILMGILLIFKPEWIMLNF